ncbi:MAG: hypothetical protein F4Y08_00070, partial [Caldilineaceae bacterium SB0662_bin_9]|nr:hypothetical protein [Caldilineaceae bacterium SB0662_bin_9]
MGARLATLPSPQTGARQYQHGDRTQAENRESKPGRHHAGARRRQVGGGGGGGGGPRPPGGVWGVGGFGGGGARPGGGGNKKN